MAGGISTQKLEELAARMQAAGITEADLLERFVRASGPGGQKVNKTSSCVYLKHLPSGLEVKVQTERSQALNRYFARRRLVEKMESLRLGAASAEAQRIAKIQRQKRKRSKRAKAKLLANKRYQGEKKALRGPIRDE